MNSLYFMKLISPQLGLYVTSIPTMQFGKNSQKYSCHAHVMLSLTKCVWHFKNNALLDTLKHALFSNSHSLPDAARELHDEQDRLSDKKPLEAQSSLSTAPTDPRALVCNK